jgi:hypothetical protein
LPGIVGAWQERGKQKRKAKTVRTKRKKETDEAYLMVSQKTKNRLLKFARAEKRKFHGTGAYADTFIAKSLDMMEKETK